MAKWEKGKSGNPGGRPKTRDLRALLRRQYGEDARVLVDRLERFSQGRGLIALQATEKLLAYHSGTPTSSVDLNVSGEIAPLRIVIEGGHD